MRDRIVRSEGEVLVVRKGPEREPNVAKRVVGMAKVAKSFAVKRYSVWMKEGAFPASLI